MNRKWSWDMVFINTLVKKSEWKKIQKKHEHKIPSRPNFSDFWLAITQKQFCQPVDFLGSKYSFTKFSSRTQNSQIFALSLFFLPFKIHQEIFLILSKSYNCEVDLSPNYLEKKFLIRRCLHVLSYVSFRNELQFWGLSFHFCIANDHN